MSTVEQDGNFPHEGDTPAKPKSWKQWKDIDNGLYSFVKGIYVSLNGCDGFMEAEEIAKATGMGFTEQEIIDICEDSQWPIATKEVDGKPCVKVNQFLDKFITELRYEENPHTFYPERKAKMEQVMAEMGWEEWI